MPLRFVGLVLLAVAGAAMGATTSFLFAPPPTRAPSTSSDFESGLRETPGASGSNRSRSESTRGMEGSGQGANGLADRGVSETRASRSLDATSPEALTLLAAELEKLPVPTYEPGAGVISGRVVTDDGDPLGGVEVSCVIWGMAPGLAEPDVLAISLEEYVRIETEQYHYDQAHIRRTTTDEEGRFSLERLQDGQYWLEAHKENWWVNTRSRAARRVDVGDDVELLAYAARQRTIRVYDAAGRSPAWAWICFTDPLDEDIGRYPRFAANRLNRNRTQMWVPERSVAVYAQLPNREWTELVELDRRSSDPIEIHTRPEKPSVGGRVEGLLPGSVGQVVVTPMSGGGSLESILDRSFAPGEADYDVAVRTDLLTSGASGTVDYSLSVDTAGSYVIGLRGRAWTGVQVVEIGPGKTRVDFRAPESMPDEVVRVRLRGLESQRGSRPVSVWCALRSLHGNGRTHEIPLTSDAALVLALDELKGDVDLRMESALPWHEQWGLENEEAMALAVAVAAPGYGEAVAPIRRVGEGWEAEVAFAPAVDTTLRIGGFLHPRDRSGLSLTLYRVRSDSTELDTDDLDGFERVWRQVHRLGDLSLGALAPGRYAVIVTRADNEYELLREVIEIDTNRASPAIELPPVYRLIVRATEAEAGRDGHVWGTAGSRVGTEFEIDTDGQAWLPLLPEGEYWIRYREASSRVLLNRDLVIALESRPGLMVEEISPEFSAETGLRTDDLVIEWNGTTVTSLRQYYALCYASLGAAPVTVTVERQGSRLEFQVEILDGIQAERFVSEMELVPVASVQEVIR